MWFGHVERMGGEECAKTVYEGESEGPNRRGRPLGRWKDRMEEYLVETDINAGECMKKKGRSVGMGRGGDSSAMATLWRDVSAGSKASVIDR